MQPLLASFWDTAKLCSPPRLSFIFWAAVLRDAIGLSARSGHSVSKL